MADRTGLELVPRPFSALQRNLYINKINKLTPLGFAQLRSVAC